MIHGRITKKTYDELLSKTQAKLSAWGKNHLSMAGRLTLVNSVLTAIPSYQMQSSFLPEHVVKQEAKRS